MSGISGSAAVQAIQTRGIMRRAQRIAKTTKPHGESASGEIGQSDQMRISGVTDKKKPPPSSGGAEGIDCK